MKLLKAIIGANEKYGNLHPSVIGSGSYPSVDCKIISCEPGFKVKIGPNIVVFW